MPIEPPETIVTDDSKVACDGGGGALGHPKVYYDLHTNGFIDCGYCDRRFVWKHHKAAAAILQGMPPGEDELAGRH